MEKSDNLMSGKDKIRSRASNIGVQQKMGNGTPGRNMEVTNDPKVLMYHRIVDDRSLSRKEKFCLHIDDFEQQLKLLNQLGYTPITFKDYQLSQEDKLQLPKKPVILTFDDGYQDFYRLAFPAMQEQGMKGVIFVLGDRSLRFNYWDAEASDVSKAPLMSDEKLIELHSSGFEIGSHSISHSNLREMDRKSCYNEVYKSKIILEGMLDSKVISFCYPYGLVNSEVKEVIAEAGYHYACSVYSGPAEFGQDPFEIRRIAIHNTTTLGGFMMRLVAPYEYFEWIWWKANDTMDSTEELIK